MGGLTEEQKLENLKCEWVNVCLQVRQGMRRWGIETIPLTRKWDEFEEKKNTAEVGADLNTAVSKG